MEDAELDERIARIRQAEKDAQERQKRTAWKLGGLAAMAGSSAAAYLSLVNLVREYAITYGPALSRIAESVGRKQAAKEAKSELFDITYIWTPAALAASAALFYAGRRLYQGRTVKDIAKEGLDAVRHVLR